MLKVAHSSFLSSIEEIIDELWAIFFAPATDDEADGDESERRPGPKATGHLRAVAPTT